MKKILTSLLLLLGSLSAFTQVLDKEAHGILEQMKNKFDAYTAIEIDFELEIEIPEQALETQKGKIIQSGNKYQVNVDDQSIYCNGESVWVHLKSNNEVQINDFEEDMGNEIMSPEDILKAYESGEYSYALTIEMREDGKTVQQIEFKPNDRDSEYSKMRLTILKDKQEIKRLKVFAKDGSRFTMHVKNLKPNLEYSSETFMFDEKRFPNIHVEDLRL